MARFGILVVLVVAWSVAGHARQVSVHFHIVQSDPGLTASLASPLARGEGLYVRLAYRSDRPVRFRISGYADGAEVTSGAMYNGAPPYPAGEGEALVWLAYSQPTRIDQIRITALDAGWQPLAAAGTPVDLSWIAAAGHRQPAAWAIRMSEAQQETVLNQIEQQDGRGGAIAFFLLVGGVLAYFVLQPLTVLWFDGHWRVAALIPLVATVPLILQATLAFTAGANLWPVMLIFYLPVATLYLLGLAGVRSFVVGRISEA